MCIVTGPGGFIFMTKTPKWFYGAAVNYFMPSVINKIASRVLQHYLLY